MGLSLKLLGEFAVRDETGKALSLPTRKTRALLAYLAINADKPQQRERLMTLLWSDRGEQQARHSLNQALMSIRRLGNAAGVPILDGDGERVTLLGDALEIDVADFRDQLSVNPTGAAALYDGPFLDGLTIPDPAFEEWQTATRSELHDGACDALSRAADQAMKDGDAAGGIDALRRLVALDPLHEDAHRRLMKLLHDNGDRAGALRQYQSCADLLKKELQIEPDALTRALYEEIRSDTSPLTAAVPLGPVAEHTRAASPLPLPDKPSIAVLPFDNLGSGPAQNFFGDGIAEDVITELSRFHSLFVIARGSSFSFKGRSLDTREIARELGVRYILEGSVRAHGPRIRINAQLIDADSGHHVWSERYDRETEDIFALQDEITGSIVSIIEPAIGGRERERARVGGRDRLDAWAMYQRGMTHYYRTTREDFEEALSLFSKAVSIDPNFASAHAMRADTMFRQCLHFMPEKKDELVAAGLAAAETAVRLDPLDANCHFALGRIRVLRSEFDTAIVAIDRALELNPNFAMAHFGRGWALLRNKPEEALECFDKARRLSPNDPFYAGFMILRAATLFSLERYEEAVETARIATQSANPRSRSSLFLAASLKQLGRDEEAHAVIRDALRQFPEFRISFIEQTLGYFSPDVAQKYIELLRAAGMPE